MARISRRAALGAASALAVAGGASAAATTPHPDGELIEACAQHRLNTIAFDEDDKDSGDDNPLWVAYMRTHDIINNAEPKTMAGVLAKARAAMFDGGEANYGRWNGTDGEAWAIDIVYDLLHLHGKVA